MTEQSLAAEAASNLSEIETKRLAALESQIETGLTTFVQVGEALMEVRDSRLYRAEFDTFEDYGRERWGLSESRSYQLMNAAQISTIVEVSNESQARELAPLKDDEQEIVAAWREAKDAAEAEGTKLSAKVVRNAVQKRVDRIKRERESEEQRARPIEPVSSELDSTTIHGDFREVLNDLDLAGGVVITDPPYPREFLPLWADLADHAASWGCDAIVAMTGQTILPESIASLSRGPWQYRWCGAYLTIGPATRVWGANAGTSWKPILVFDRGGDRDFLTTDLFRSTGDDKQHHYWGQNENGIAALVEAFTNPGDLVIDPFLGGGTTAAVCKGLGRRFVGCDIDSLAVSSARERLAA